MVIPRMRSSGALSICAQSRARPPCRPAITFVIAAVKVVLPWSTCPIVPTFTCSLPMVFSSVDRPGRPKPNPMTPKCKKPPRTRAREGLVCDESFQLLNHPVLSRAHDDDDDRADGSASPDDDDDSVHKRNRMAG